MHERADRTTIDQRQHASAVAAPRSTAVRETAPEIGRAALNEFDRSRHWESGRDDGLVVPQPLSLKWFAAYAVRNARTALPLGLADLAAVGTAAAVAAAATGVDPWWPWAPWLVLGVLLLFAVGRLYPGIGLEGGIEWRRCTYLLALLFTATLIAFLISGAPWAMVGAVGITGLLSAGLVPIARRGARRLCQSIPGWRQPVLVFGDGDAARVLCRKLASHRTSGLEPLGVLGNLHRHWERASGGDEADLFLGPPEAAAEILRHRRVDRAIVVLPEDGPADRCSLLEHAAALFPHITVIPESPSCIRLATAGDWRLDQFIGREFHSRLLAPVPHVAKRMTDLILVAAAALVALPVTAIVAPMIWLASPGPVFFAQVRVGRGGRRFRLWKFRTMWPDAEHRLDDYLAHHPERRAQWEREHKIDNDPRVIPLVGTFLRKSSLDELPQLWNVWKGDMSLVGPRPLPEYHLDQFDDWFRRYRERVTPGITGLWQVESRDDSSPEMFMKWDMAYIRDWSLAGDLRILARTVRVVLRGIRSPRAS